MRGNARSLTFAAQVQEGNSYAKWFLLVIAVLLVVLTFQLFKAIRSDRRASQERDDGEPGQVEDWADAEYAVDALGDVDDLGVHDHAPLAPVAVQPADDDTSELPAITDELEYYEEEGDWGAEPEPEPEPEPPPPPPAMKAPAKKTPAKKAPAKKTPTRKTPVKETPVKKATAKKEPAKKTPAKKATKRPPES